MPAYLRSLFILILSGMFNSSYSQVVINEYSVSNLSTIQDNYEEYEDWIELYNSGGSTFNIGGYFLSDDTASPYKWQFPAGITIPSGGYRIIWASGRNEAFDGYYHTNFRLTQTNADPDWIVITDRDSNLVERRQLEITQHGHSRGRTTNGGQSWGIFLYPTPGYSNNNATSYVRYTEKPTMSVTGGFYTEPQTITMTTTEPESQIRYTSNGNEPLASSMLYTTPIIIPTTKIIKARVFSTDPEILPGLIEFNTYFINESTTLPVLSVAGNDLLELLNGNQALRPFGSIEFYDKLKVRTTTSYGEYNEHGQDSWVHPQRSIDHISRDECGYNNALDQKFFSMSDRDEFQRVILRAAGDDNYPGIDTSAHIRDDYIQTLSQKAGQQLDWRKSERIAMYANGQYWGIYSIREKVHDHDYTDYYYDQGKYDLQFIMLWGATWAEYGGQQALDDWYELHNFIMSHDMGNPFTYQAVAAQYDITSLVDYVILNSYVVCSDWMNWNVGWWRGLNPEGSHGKWAYILWDEDATFGHYINYTGIPAQSPYVSPCYPEGLLAGWQDPEGHIAVLNKLRANEEFDQYYISRYIDLLNVAFNNEFMIPLLDSMALIIQPEMLRHTAKWGGSLVQWQSNVQKIRNFVTTRNAMIQGGLADCYNLTGPFNITIDVEPEGKGLVKINSLELQSYPWDASYFGNIDVKLWALETDPYFEFDHWELNNHTVAPNDSALYVILNLTGGDDIIAHFRPRVFVDSLVINEINYNSASNFDPEDWIELYNPMDHELDATGWTFKDEDDEHIYTIPEGTVISEDGYLVLCRDTAAFHLSFPQVTTYIGNFDFGLGNNGDLLRLYDTEGVLVDTVHYDDQEPWPLEPDGMGPTLELINPAWDNALAESWAAAEVHGTPGEKNGMFVWIPLQKPVEQVKCVVYPNPFSSDAMILIDGSEDISGLSIEIFNIYGNPVRKIEGTSTSMVPLYRQDLPSGIYIYRIYNKKNKLLFVGKFVVV